MIIILFRFYFLARASHGRVVVRQPRPQEALQSLQDPHGPQPVPSQSELDKEEVVEVVVVVVVVVLVVVVVVKHLYSSQPQP